MNDVYKFKSDVNENEYNEFLLKNNYYAFTQLPEWAKVKDNWKSFICGLYKNDKLVAGTLLLERKLPFGKSILYAPRGFILDYSDKELLKAFTNGVKSFAKKQGAISVKLDPFVPKRGLEKQDLMPDFGNDFDTVTKNLTDLGYIHHGLKTDLGAYFQPRFNMAIPLFDENGVIDKKALLKTFTKRIRDYIGNYHKNRGVTFVSSCSKNDVDEFVRILSFTEERQNIALRNAEYFNKILDAYGERAQIYFSRMHLPTYIAYIEGCIAKGQNVEKNQHLCNEAKAIMAEKGESINLSAGLLIFPKAGEKVKVAEYLYAGADITVFRNLGTPNGLIYKSACDAIDMGCQYYNLGGVDGDMTSPLANFKLKFAPHVFEFPGEFDLPVDKLMYMSFEKLLPVAKKMLKR